MSPRKSRLSKLARRTRRVFAAPFVLTAALAPGCVIKDAPPPQRQTQTQPETRYDQNGNEVTTKPVSTEPNQPAGSGTISEDRTPTKTLPPVIANPPPPSSQLPDPPANANGTVVTRENGTCWFSYTVECPPKATCNPPPPLQVKCEK